jgi:hypothetical protein
MLVIVVMRDGMAASLADYIPPTRYTLQTARRRQGFRAFLPSDGRWHRLCKSKDQHCSLRCTNHHHYS